MEEWYEPERVDLIPGEYKAPAVPEDLPQDKKVAPFYQMPKLERGEDSEPRWGKKVLMTLATPKGQKIQNDIATQLEELFPSQAQGFLPRGWVGSDLTFAYHYDEKTNLMYPQVSIQLRPAFPWVQYKLMKLDEACNLNGQILKE